MALLVLERVSTRCGHVELCDVSLEVDAGELVGVLGRRHSGRTTLLHVAAGIEVPEKGRAIFDGVPLPERDMLGVRAGIALCTTTFPPVIGGSVVEQVAAPLLGAGESQAYAHARAHVLLTHMRADATVALAPGDLNPAEALRAGLARALASEPRLLLVDDPVVGVRLSERDDALGLLASIAHRDGVAVLMTVDSATELAGCDRAATLDMGELRGETTTANASVIRFERRRSDSSA